MCDVMLAFNSAQPPAVSHSGLVLLGFKHCWDSSHVYRFLCVHVNMILPKRIKTGIRLITGIVKSM